MKSALEDDDKGNVNGRLKEVAVEELQDLEEERFWTCLLGSRSRRRSRRRGSLFFVTVSLKALPARASIGGCSGNTRPALLRFKLHCHHCGHRHGGWW